MGFEQDILSGVDEIFAELPTVTATFTFRDRGTFDGGEGEWVSTETGVPDVVISPVVSITEKQQKEYGFEEATAVCYAKGSAFTSPNLPTLATKITINSKIWNVEKVVTFTPGQSTVAAYMFGLKK